MENQKAYLKLDSESFKTFVEVTEYERTSCNENNLVTTSRTPGTLDSMDIARPKRFVLIETESE